MDQVPAKSLPIPSTQANKAETQQVATQTTIGPNSTTRSALHAEISVLPRPIKLDVDTSTDWLAAVITPVIVGLTAAYIAWLNQRNSIRSAELLQSNSIRSAETLQKMQLRGSIANFRQTWSTDFRTFSAAYISACTRLHYKNFESPAFTHTPAADDLLTEMTIARASIRMMLDKEKSYTKELTDIMDDIETALFDAHPTDPQSPQPYLKAFVDKAQEVRELAWQDIKKDLSAK